MQILKVIQKRGYTLERVADELGITKGSLSATINGSPNVKKLIDIALKIGCSPAEFFDDWYENEGKGQQRPAAAEPAHAEATKQPATEQPEEGADALPFQPRYDVGTMFDGVKPAMPASLICPHCGKPFVIEVKAVK